MSAVTAERTMYLAEIVEHVRGVVAERKRSADRQAMERAAAEHTPRGFARALRARAASGPAVIAELKKASPSKGLIRAEFDVEALARGLEAGGAAVLSVLTEDRFFQGSLENLQRASAAVGIPCLRKDFMVDPWQMLEARANRADAVLLIVAALTDGELRTLRDEARRCGLDVLCEVHDPEELERALRLDCECVGVNSRDLRTFQVSMERMVEMGAMLPHNVVRVAESGIRSRVEVERLQTAGYEAFLVGESLMRQPDPGGALRQLLAGDA